MRRWNRRVFSVSGFVFLVFLWHWGSIRPGWNHFLFPAPLLVLRRMVNLLNSGILAKHLSASLMRVFCGFGISVLVAFPLGIA
jgi:sulfonate transport system permease protein